MSDIEDTFRQIAKERSEMAGIEELYNLVKPIADAVEQNKADIDAVVHTIEFGVEVTEEQWDVISNISSRVLDMSFSGGDTTMNALKDMVTQKQE